MAKKEPTQFLVIGLGRFGQALAKKLFTSGADVMVIDTDMTKINLASDFSTEAVCADASNEQTLEQLGVEHFDAIINCVGAIEPSIIITLICKQLGAKKIITKAKTDKHRDVLQKIGTDLVVFPEEEAGLKLGSMLYNPNMIELVELTDNYKLIEIRTPRKWANKTLMQLNIRKNHKVNIVLVTRDEENVITSFGGDFVLMAGDILVIGGEPQDLDKLKAMATEKVEEF